MYYPGFKCPVCQGNGVSLKEKTFASRLTPATCHLCKVQLIPDLGISLAVGAIGYLLMICAAIWAFMIQSWLPIVGYFICAQIAFTIIPLVNKDQSNK
jgi:hypothetical protein